MFCFSWLLPSGAVARTSCDRCPLLSPRTSARSSCKSTSAGWTCFECRVHWPFSFVSVWFLRCSPFMSVNTGSHFCWWDVCQKRNKYIWLLWLYIIIIIIAMIIIIVINCYHHYYFYCIIIENHDYSHNHWRKSNVLPFPFIFILDFYFLFLLKFKWANLPRGELCE